MTISWNYANNNSRNVKQNPLIGFLGTGAYNAVIFVDNCSEHLHASNIIPCQILEYMDDLAQDFDNYSSLVME